MNAQQIPKLVSILVEHQEEFIPLSTEDAQWVIKNPKETISLFVDAVKNRVREEIVTVKNILSPVKSITIGAMAEKKTADCFTDKSRYYHRDSNLDILLPEIQEARGIEQGTANQLTENSKFVGMVQSLLGVVEDSLSTLSRLVVGHIYTLTQIEALIERREAGEDIGLLTNGWASFFLALNKEGSVSVVYAGRDDGRWDVGLISLGSDNLWDAESRFFSRNLTL